MTGIFGDIGVTPSDLSNSSANNLSSMSALIPGASNITPPGIGVSGALGATTNSFARPDHTHASSVQRRTITTSINAGISTATWTFNTPYSVIPVVTALIQNASNANQPYVVEIISISTTAVTFKVWQAQSTTLGSTLLSIVGLALTPFIAAPANVSINCWAALPTQ